jgi:hypothetical protein
MRENNMNSPLNEGIRCLPSHRQTPKAFSDLQLGNLSGQIHCLSVHRLVLDGALKWLTQIERVWTFRPIYNQEYN